MFQELFVSLSNDNFIVFKVWTGAYNSLIVVRHPFDRVLSAYRDRIMNKGTGQAINHIPRIFIALKVGMNSFLSKSR